MAEIKVGDIVARKSYGSDILFKVVKVDARCLEKKYILKGINYRLEADAPEDDIVIQSIEQIRKDNMKALRV